MALSRLSMSACVHLCVHPETLLTQYVTYHLTHLTFKLGAIPKFLHYITLHYSFTRRTSTMHYGTVWGQKVKQDHSGIKYVGNRTFWVVNTMS